MRTGLIGKKVGMTRVFADGGRHVPVTVISLEGCQVVGRREAGRDGYTALILGAGEARPKRLNKADKGRFAKAKVPARHKLAEFRVSEDAMVDVGAEITASHFVPGQFVDVTGVSIGRGFAGVIKRHNFRSGRASHGSSLSHRVHGSTGQCQDPGKVFKGKKMAGQLGNAKATTLNLKVVETRPEEGLVLVSGAVPGSNGSWVLIRDAVKKALPKEAPVPAGLKGMEAEKPAEGEPAPQPAPGATPEAQAGARPEQKPADEKKAEAEGKAEAKPEVKPQDKPAEDKKPEPKPAEDKKPGAEAKPDQKGEAKAEKKEPAPEKKTDGKKD